MLGGGKGIAGRAGRRRYWAGHAMLKTTISKLASRSGNRMPGLFPGQNGSEASRPVAAALEKLRICFGNMDAIPQRHGPGISARTARNVNSRGLAAPTTRNHAGAPAISQRPSSRKAPRRSFASDARWRRTETGTRKTGTSTSGNRLINRERRIFLNGDKRQSGAAALSLSGAFIAVARAVSADGGERFVKHCAISRNAISKLFGPAF